MVDRFTPRDQKDVAAAVEWALAGGKTLEIVGGGSKREIGRAAQWDLTLDLSGLSGVTLYEPEELVLSAKAGTPIDWDYARWRDVLGSYSIDRKPEFDLTHADDRAQLDSLIHEYRPDGPMIEDCPTLLQQSADRDPVTDDNMGTEWRTYFRSE